MNTVAQLLKQGSDLLRFTDNPLLEAQLLLAKVLGCERIKLITWPEQAVSEEQTAFYRALIERRLLREPLAYIIGTKEFWSLNLKVNSHVLVPRPDTELLVETVLAQLPKEKLTILELGTGSGVIACALAHERPTWQVFATDISSDALTVATENAKALQLFNISFMQSNWFEAIPQQAVAAIISNPPYLSHHDPHLKEDLLHEPQSALVSGITGLEAYEAIIANAQDYLVPGGLLAFEHGYEQATAIQQLLIKAGYIEVLTVTDLAGLPRVTFARKS